MSFVYLKDCRCRSLIAYKGPNINDFYYKFVKAETNLDKSILWLCSMCRHVSITTFEYDVWKKLV